MGHKVRATYLYMLKQGLPATHLALSNMLWIDRLRVNNREPRDAYNKYMEELNG